MGANSKIEWTNHTFNPWRGCTKVSEGCANCYAERQSKRNPGVLGVWGPNGSRVVAAESYWRQPFKWNLEAAIAKERRRVFCASISDVFEDWRGKVVDSQGCELMMSACDVEPFYEPIREGYGYYGPASLDNIRERLFRLILATPNLDWLLLTKRPENVNIIIEHAAKYIWRDGWPTNVWIGTSVENQAMGDKRIPELLKVPSAVRFLSCEPLLGPVDLRSLGPEKWDALLGWKDAANNEQRWANTSRIDWVIAGGESGPAARPMHPDWARSLRDQCQAAGVAFFMKQMGGVKDKRGDLEDIPEDLQIRELPNATR